MRHYRRLQYSNTTPDHLFVAIVDKGNDPPGSHCYSTIVEKVSNPNALTYMLASACFFKLPVGADAVVDLYVEDEEAVQSPITFDVHISKARMATLTDAQKANLKSIQEKLDEIPRETLQGASASNNSLDSAAPITLGSTCSLSYSCNGQTTRPCPDPLEYYAACIANKLVCVAVPPPNNP